MHHFCLRQEEIAEDTVSTTPPHGYLTIARRPSVAGPELLIAIAVAVPSPPRHSFIRREVDAAAAQRQSEREQSNAQRQSDREQAAREREQAAARHAAERVEWFETRDRLAADAARANQAAADAQAALQQKCCVVS